MKALWNAICHRNGWHPVLFIGGTIAVGIVFLLGYYYQ